MHNTFLLIYWNWFVVLCVWFENLVQCYDNKNGLTLQSYPPSFRANLIQWALCSAKTILWYVLIRTELRCQELFPLLQDTGVGLLHNTWLLLVLPATAVLGRRDAARKVSASFRITLSYVLNLLCIIAKRTWNLRTKEDVKDISLRENFKRYSHKIYMILNV